MATNQTILDEPLYSISLKTALLGTISTSNWWILVATRVSLYWPRFLWFLKDRNFKETSFRFYLTQQHFIKLLLYFVQKRPLYHYTILNQAQNALDVMHITKADNAVRNGQKQKLGPQQFWIEVLRFNEAIGCHLQTNLVTINVESQRPNWAEFFHWGFYSLAGCFNFLAKQFIAYQPFSLLQ